MGVVEDLQRSVVTHGNPKEIWLVPGIEQQRALVLTEPLRKLGVRCLVVTHKAVVGGILAGCLAAVHAEAQPFTRLSTEEGSFPATQQQMEGAPVKRRRAMPRARGAVVNMVPWQEPMGLPLAEAFDSQPQALPASLGQLGQIEQHLEVDSQAIPQFAF